MWKQMFGAGVLVLSAATTMAATVTVGVIAPLSGGAAPWGEAMKIGAELAAEDMNATAQSGVKGSDGDKFVVKSYDDKYTAAGAVSAYQRLTTIDSSHYIITLSSAATQALNRSVRRDDVLLLTGAYSEDAIDRTNKHLISLYSLPASFVPRMIKWLSQNRGARRVALVAPNDETGWGTAKVLEDAFGKLGYTLTDKEFFERGQSDFSPLVAKVLRSDPEIVEVGTTPAVTAGLLVRQLRDAGYKGLITKLGGAGDAEEIVKTAGQDAAQGMLIMSYADTNSPKWQELGQRYKAKTGHEPVQILVPYYDGAKILMEGIKAADYSQKVGATLEKLQTVLPSTSVLGNSIAAGKDGVRQFVTTNYIAEIQKGVPVIVGNTEK